jgi:hypothetical protein
MKLREGPSDALLDKIIGSDRIVRQTSRIPPRVGQVGFDAPVQNGLRGAGLCVEGGVVIGDDGTVVSRLGISSLLLITSPKKRDLA